jgi:hypothetical protein
VSSEVSNVTDQPPHSPDQPSDRAQWPPSDEPFGSAPNTPQPYPGYPGPNGPPPFQGQYPPYGQVPYYQAPPNAGTNGLAIASLVLGILWIYWIGSILAIIFGYMARKQIAESGGIQQGGGMATAGIVLGWIGVGVMGLMFLFMVVAIGSSGP